MASTKRSSFLSLNLIYLLLLAAGVVAIIVGMQRYEQLPEPVALLCISFGAAAVLLTLAVFPIALMLQRPRTTVDLERLEQLLAAVQERQLISDAAKRINARHSDCALLDRAIQEDIASGDLESAILLTHDLAQSFGKKHDSEDYREKIIAASAAEYQQRISQAISSFEQMLAEQQWEFAKAKAAKLQRLYPEAAQVHDLPARVERMWAQHKQDLERQFLVAAQCDDVELATRLLKDLDNYLTEAEAAPFVEVARGVFHKKKENLGVQFKMAVHDRDWIMAVQIGEQLTREFPNSRMAAEILGMIDSLRERAANQSAASRQL
jgi:hypothetical protein